MTTCIVAVAQEQPRWEPRAEGLTRRVMEMARAGASEGARLVVLPALLGWSTVGVRLGIRLDASFGLEGLPPVDGTAGLYETYHLAGEDALQAYREAARACRVWLVGGSLPEVSVQGVLYNAAPVVAPNGLVAGWQRETHVSSAWRSRGVARGAELAVIPSEAGKLGLVLGEDVRYPEVGRILALSGAEILGIRAPGALRGGRIG
ncbi:MAG: carbon-nitrogen hydrolase family protein [Anaerolineae bacterium]